MKLFNIIVALGICFCCCTSLFATDIYVGKESLSVQRDGSLENPFESLEAALRAARELRRLNTSGIEQGITIWIKPGTYTPDQTIRLKPEDSGSANSPTHIKSVGGDVIFSGGREIIGWEPLKRHAKLPKQVWNKVAVADAPKVGGKKVSLRQLWVNGTKAIRAESHDDQHLPRILSWDFEKELVSVPNVFPDYSYTAGQEFFIHQWWAIAQLRLKDAFVTPDSITFSFYQPESKIQNEHPWPKPWLSEEYGNSAFRLVNALQFLDRPGEWFLDEEEGKVYYYLREGESHKDLQVIFSYLEEILRIEGTLESPVGHIKFEGISFKHAAWNRPNTHGHVALQTGMYFEEAYKLEQAGTKDKKGLENQAWVGRPSAAVVLKNTHDVLFSRCDFSHHSSTAFDFEEGNLRDSLIGSVVYDVGGNGVLVGHFSSENMEAHLPYLPQDERRLSRHVVVRNNFIHHVTNEDWGAVGIGAGFVQDIVISHNDLSELSYSGISLGWGWTPTVNSMKNNLVEYNRITRYGKYMYDVAGIYTLSAQPGTKIQYNSIDSIYRSPYAHIPDHWFYLYTDEGSAYMQVSNNWFPENKILKNANGPGVIWENNGPEANLEKSDVGLEKPYRSLFRVQHAVDTNLIFNQYIPFEKPVFVQIYDEGRTHQKQDVVSFAKAQGIEDPEIYEWGNYYLLVTNDELGKKVNSALMASHPQLQVDLFNDLFYAFEREKYGEAQSNDGELDYVLLTAQLKEDKALQEEYFRLHDAQVEEWPEVIQGFYNAGFEEVLVYRKGRQLLLYISYPKGQNFAEIDKLTTKDNPRVEEWNKIMSTYQEGIKGTDKGEVWIFYKK